MRAQYNENDVGLLPELEAILDQGYYAGGARDQEYPDYERESPAQPAKPKTIWRHNTDLNAPYFGGNFNFLYNGGANEALVTFNTYLSFRKSYSEQERKAFVRRLRNAVAMWDNAAQIQIKDRHGSYNRINLRFELKLVTSPRHANKVTDIHPNNTWSSWFNGKNREIVMRELNVFIGSAENVLAHELGHVWGLLDEYDTAWLEKKFSPGHVGTGSPLIKDVKSIMNIGYQNPANTGEFRTRHFQHFGRVIASAFWSMPDYIIPNIHQGKTVAKTIQGRIALLKKDMAGSAPYTTDIAPLNPQYTYFQLAKR